MLGHKLSNRVTRDGAREIALVLRRNSSLHALVLNNNSLEDEGVQLLLEDIADTSIDTCVGKKDKG